MKVLITGGAGFLGSSLAEFHLARGDTVLAVDDLSTGSIANVSGLGSRFRLVCEDLLLWDNLAEEVSAVDRIYHMAAVVGMFRVLREPARVMKVNVGTTERVLQAAALAGHKPEVVIASSSSVYGHSRAAALQEDAELVYTPRRGGLTGYAVSKLANELQAMAYAQANGLRVTIPRLFNAVGVRQTGAYGFVLPRFLTQALSGAPLTVFGDGSQTRSFCDVRDTVEALDLLASEPAACAMPVNVGNARETSIIDLAKMVIARTGSRSAIEHIPFDRAYGQTFEHVTQRRPAVERLHNLTGFTARHSLEDTIDSLITLAEKEVCAA